MTSSRAHLLTNVVDARQKITCNPGKNVFDNKSAGHETCKIIKLWLLARALHTSHWKRG